jgi:16S rRNA G966 N2-methylase RsmD
VIAGDFRRVLAALADTGGRFDVIFVDSPYTGDVTAEVLALLTRYDLIAAEGYVVTRQFHRAASAGSAALECASTARLGDHRIALYRRLAPPAPTEG